MDLETHLDGLLAGKDRLSNAEREQILDRVLVEVARADPRPARAGWLQPRWAVVALVLVLVAPAALFLWNSRDDAQFTARGGRGAAPGLEIVCLDAAGRPGQCVPGGKLIFEPSPGRFRAFAALALAPDGTTFWYFPNDAFPTSLDLAHAKQTDLLGRAVVLDAHAAGDYTLYAVFSEDPLTKEQVRWAIRKPGQPGIAVVTRELHVQEDASP